MALEQQDDHHCVWRERCEQLERIVAVQADQLTKQSSQLEAQSVQLEKLEAQSGKLSQLESLIAGTLERIQVLEEKNSALEAELKKQKKRKYGRSSEKRGRRKKPYKIRTLEEKAESLAKRRQRRELQRQLATETISHKVDESERTCPDCGKQRRPFGEGRVTEIIDLVLAELKRERHVQEKLSCGCGHAPILAPAPQKPIFGGRYGAGLIAHIIVSKCMDNMPIHRLAKRFERQGFVLAKSTINSLLDQSGQLLEPLVNALRKAIASSEIVASDDTGVRVHSRGSKTQRGCARGYVWTFSCLLTGLVYFTLRPTQNQSQPLEVLKQSDGYLVSDGTSRYNSVTKKGQRISCGCWAHARRGFWELQDSFEELSGKVLDLTEALYAVESKARKRGILGSAEHLALRHEESKPILDKLKIFLDGQKDQFPPKTPMGKAINYTLNQWKPLTRFLNDPRIPLDNNSAENDLRSWVLGRKNWLFVGNDESGNRLAGLCSLVKSCERNGVNPEKYLIAVLSNLDAIRESNIEEWLPHKWRDPPQISD